MPIEELMKLYGGAFSESESESSKQETKKGDNENGLLRTRYSHTGTFYFVALAKLCFKQNSVSQNSGHFARVEIVLVLSQF